ncbi:carboxylesterase family protein [Myxococcota bacterium]|nr:carboxylesterase family protein [Myxococcota bacterium]
MGARCDIAVKARRHGLARILAACALASACASTPPPTPEAGPGTARSVAQGALVGYEVEGRDAHAWRGIPFAEPPVGELRWRAPRPPMGWQGTLEALTSGPACPQFDVTSPGDLTGDEDCLTLDVYAPAFAPDAVPQGDARLPVMVWIHGGGNSIGEKSMYDGSILAAENGVVVVTLQYRLGIHGWFSHPALRAGAQGPDDASGNFGTLDLIRGLEWVRDHIAAFGGNPDNVTVFGESAGGTNVYSLLLSPRAEGLFQRAISQSGSVRTRTLAEAEHYTDAPNPGLPGSSAEVLIALLQIDGRAADREAAKAVAAQMSDDEIASYLRGKSSPELLAVFDGPGGMGGMYGSPRIFRDGHVVVAGDPLEALATPGKHNAVPFIAGTNRDEVKLFMAMGAPQITRLLGVPLWFNDANLYDLHGEYGSLSWKASGVDDPLRALRRAGDSPVYGYRFDWDEEPQVLWLDLSQMIGAGHAVEIFFVFGFTDLGRATGFVYDDVDSAAELSRQMRSYWTQFATTGDPGRGRNGALPPWPGWGDDGGRFLVFDSSRDGGLEISDDTVTLDSVVARVAGDDRFENSAQRCEIYATFTQRGEVMSVEEYESVEGGICRDHPLPSFP